MLLQVLHRGLELVEPATHAGQQLLALGRQLDTATGTLEKLHLQVVLERLDLLADRRRRHVQGLGGVRERQARSDRLEDAQRVERQPGIGGGHVSFPYGRFRKRVCSWRHSSADCTHGNFARRHANEHSQPHSRHRRRPTSARVSPPFSGNARGAGGPRRRGITGRVAAQRTSRCESRSSTISNYCLPRSARVGAPCRSVTTAARRISLPPTPRRCATIKEPQSRFIWV